MNLGEAGFVRRWWGERDTIDGGRGKTSFMSKRECLASLQHSYLSW